MPIPGYRCVDCLERGHTVWVIPGKCCAQCSRPAVPEDVWELESIDKRRDERKDVQNAAEMRRIQNRVAQRIFREKYQNKQRTDTVITGINTATTSKGERSANNPSGGEALSSLTHHTSSTGHYHGEESEFESESISQINTAPESGTIKCICNFKGDRRHLVQCEKCGNWQHIACYYKNAMQVVVEIHECIDCSPRNLTRKTVVGTDGWEDSSSVTDSIIHTEAGQSSVGIEHKADLNSDTRSDIEESQYSGQPGTARVGRSIQKPPSKPHEPPGESLSSQNVASNMHSHRHSSHFRHLREYCEVCTRKEPTIKRVYAQFVPTSTWVATIEVDGKQYSSRSWQGALSRERAIEDAAFIALRRLENSFSEMRVNIFHEWAKLFDLREADVPNAEARTTNVPSVDNLRSSSALDTPATAMGNDFHGFPFYLSDSPDFFRSSEEASLRTTLKDTMTGVRHKQNEATPSSVATVDHPIVPRQNPRERNRQSVMLTIQCEQCRSRNDESNGTKPSCGNCLDKGWRYRYPKISPYAQSPTQWHKSDALSLSSTILRTEGTGDKPGISGAPLISALFSMATDPEVCTDWHTALLKVRKLVGHLSELRCPKCLSILQDDSLQVQKHDLEVVTEEQPKDVMDLHFSDEEKAPLMTLPFIGYLIRKFPDDACIESGQFRRHAGKNKCSKCLDFLAPSTSSPQQSDEKQAANSVLPSGSSKQSLSTTVEYPDEENLPSAIQDHETGRCQCREKAEVSESSHGCPCGHDIPGATYSCTNSRREYPDSVSPDGIHKQSGVDPFFGAVDLTATALGGTTVVSEEIQEVASPATQQHQISESSLPVSLKSLENVSSDQQKDSPLEPHSRSLVDPFDARTKKRIKTGCLTCRKKRIKCGEKSPTCSNCIKFGRQCKSFDQGVVFSSLYKDEVPFARLHPLFAWLEEIQVSREERVPRVANRLKTLEEEFQESLGVELPENLTRLHGTRLDAGLRQEMETSEIGSERIPKVKKLEAENENPKAVTAEETSGMEPVEVWASQPLSGAEHDISGQYEEGRISPHLFHDHIVLDEANWKDVRDLIAEDWMWDVDYHVKHSNDGNYHGCWTCTPSELDDPKNLPLTISDAPVVIPVEYQWPPMAGVNPPPDPRRSAPIDCTAELSLDVIRDIFLTFEGSIGFYFLVNGMLQILVPEDFDREWASSHLPHKFGGLGISYINQDMEPTATLFSSNTETVDTQGSPVTHSSGIGSIFRSPRTSTTSSAQTLRINDFIEAKAKSSHRKERFAGRIGMKVTKCGDPYLVMSTHVITEAILARSQLSEFLGRRDRLEKLNDDWNEHVEIWAGNEKIGTIHQSFDTEAEIYPNGFRHDITLIKPTQPTNTKDIASPIADLGWLSCPGWHTLRQRSASIKLLPSTDSHRATKTLKCSNPSQILVVGEGIFLNQRSAKPTRDHDISTWKDLVSRAVLYRVHPDFDPPRGYSGIALYAEGLREDGTDGPAVVGFQSFVQRSGHVQNFEMEGGALDKRLKLGRVAFYGAFQVPEQMKTDYRIV